MGEMIRNWRVIISRSHGHLETKATGPKNSVYFLGCFICNICKVPSLAPRENHRFFFFLSFKVNSNYINFFIFLKRIISTLGYHSIPYQKYNCTRDLEASEETWPVKFETQNGPTRMPKSIIKNNNKKKATGMSSFWKSRLSVVGT